jgi:hypothetical protein
MNSNTPSQLSDSELVDELAQLAKSERCTTASLIAHLIELDARQLHLRAGYPSLFVYCTQVLRLSEGGTYNRIEAARAARRCPAALDWLAEGLLNLGTLRLIAPYLRPESQEQLFALAAGKSKREVQEALAEMFPKPDTSPSIRGLPCVAQRRTGQGEQPAERPAQPAASTKPLGGPAEKQLAGLAEKPDAASPRPGAVAALRPVDEAVNCASHPSGEQPRSIESATSWAPSERDQRTSPSARSGPVVTPLSPDRYQFRFTASAATREKFKRAQDLLRHAVPNGEPAEVFDRALTALLVDLERRKFAATDRPRRQRGRAPGSRTVPAAVRRAVTDRDGGRCAFVASSGVRCGATAFLEFHHVVPYARGGPATEDNIQLRCRAHNGYDAELDFGRRELVPGQVGGGAMAPERTFDAMSRDGRFRNGRCPAQKQPGR